MRLVTLISTSDDIAAFSTFYSFHFPGKPTEWITQYARGVHSLPTVMGIDFTSPSPTRHQPLGKNSLTAVLTTYYPSYSFVPIEVLADSTNYPEYFV